jgi:DNA-binding phage protein
VSILNLSGKSGGTRSKSTSTRQAPPRRKPAAAKQATKQASARKQAPAKRTAPQDEGNGNGGNGRSPRIPEGMTKRDFERLVKDMQKAREAKDAAAEKLAEAQETVNQMALDLIADGLQMSVVSSNLNLSRQWLYKIMEDAGVKTERQQSGSRRRSNGATSKPAAAKRSAAKPAAKKSAAKKAPARKRPAAKKASGRGRVNIR